MGFGAVFLSAIGLWGQPRWTHRLVNAGKLLTLPGAAAITFWFLALIAVASGLVQPAPSAPQASPFPEATSANGGAASAKASSGASTILPTLSPSPSGVEPWANPSNRRLATGNSRSASISIAGVSDDGQSVAYTAGPPSQSTLLPVSLTIVDAVGSYEASSQIDSAVLSPDNAMAATSVGSDVCLTPVSRIGIQHSFVDCITNVLSDPKAGDTYLIPGSMSIDARYLTFTSDNPGWVSGLPTPTSSHVFLRDWNGGAVRLIDRTPDGAPGSCSDVVNCGLVPWSVIAEGGSAVAFDTVEGDLVSGDSNAVSDVFEWVASTNHIAQVSVGPEGEGQFDSRVEAVDGSGRNVVFSTASALLSSDTNGREDIYLRDTSTKTTSAVSVGIGGDTADGTSRAATVSSSGRFIAFISNATDLTTGTAAPEDHLYIRDMALGRTYSIPSPSGMAVVDAQISGNGRTVAFVVDAPDDPDGTKTQLWISTVDIP